ncbi:MAG: DEAD/DEAH box helicase [Firmicutes bacterium]|nr:DEAD/DEAH box helicase [Bacillota bacterium]
MNFTKKEIENALKQLNFTSLTEVQEKVIPLIFQKRNLIVEAKTGSGKTHAYLLPIFDMLDESNHELQILISAPTRELARQIFDFAKQIASFFKNPIDIRLFTGGTNRDDEIKKLEKSQPQIAIGTPGKLFDLIRKMNILKSHTAKTFIVDEADMTMDEGFLDTMDGIASTMSKDLQMLVFSATIPESIQPFLKKYLQNPISIQVNPQEISSLNISHFFIKTKEQDRFILLDKIIDSIQPYLAIIFCNEKESAEKVYSHLVERKLNVTLIHGDLQARKRKQLMSRIHSLDFQYIVATDIISRGIDIEGISHIINYELPRDVEFYIHRSGRTGRMFLDGIAISLYEFNDNTYMDKLEKKGLTCKYKEIVNHQFVDAKIRNQRQKRYKQPGKVESIAQQLVKKSSTVKPGYKKKYQMKVDKVKKTLNRKGVK